MACCRCAVEFGNYCSAIRNFMNFECYAIVRTAICDVICCDCEIETASEKQNVLFPCIFQYERD